MDQFCILLVVRFSRMFFTAVKQRKTDKRTEKWFNNFSLGLVILVNNSPVNSMVYNWWFINYLVTILNALQQERTYVELLCHYQGKWTYIYKFLVTICTHITTCMYLAALNYWVKVNTSAKCPTLLFSLIDIVHLSKQYNFVYLVS